MSAARIVTLLRLEALVESHAVGRRDLLNSAEAFSLLKVWLLLRLEPSLQYQVLSAGQPQLERAR